MKWEVLQPNGDSTLWDFPPEVCYSLYISDGVELLGVPIVVNAQYFDKFTAARFDKVKHFQDLLLELEDSPST